MSIKVFVECFAAAGAQLGSSRVIGVALSLLCSVLVSIVWILLCILSAPGPGPNEENVNKELSDTPQCIHLHSFAPGVLRTHQTPRIGLNYAGCSILTSSENVDYFDECPLYCLTQKVTLQEREVWGCSVPICRFFVDYFR